ncbi:tetratricopeptide repeat protein [Candidatus Uabimicrobium amorphum]|uniref:Beta-barrel assembly-enhancing protease n=1 Tax=Uabimicrobium amorphum TaxID=2596890 RepID=A0A5S9F364_UABAM|nr:tetratricopeptide repeat protein [Candidatus Uabimicrobium amorphum]BBM83823.1 beta-barrel assembly-enhancing protease [Candidatus Uabimicrobium amorphum]
MLRYITFSFIILVATLQAQNIDDLHRYAKKQNITDVQQQIVAGERLFRSGDYSEASFEFASAALKSPNHPVPLFYLSLCSFANKEYVLGGDILRRTIGLYPHWQKTRFNLLAIFPDNFEFLRKRDDFERWLLQTNRDENAYLLFGFLCQFSENRKKAQTAYQLVLAKNHSHMEAQKLYEIVSGEKANSFYLSYEQIEQVGYSYLRQGKFVEAVEQWATAFALYPENPQSLYNLTHSFAATGKFAHASKSLLKAFQLAPKNFSKQFSINKQFGQRSHLEDTVAKLEEKIQQNPEDLNLLFLWSYLSFLRGDTQRVQIAIEHLRQQQYHPAQVEFLWEQFLEGPQTSKREVDDEITPPIRREQPRRQRQPKSQRVKKDFSQYNPVLREGIELFHQGEYQQAAKFFTRQITSSQGKEALWLLCMTSFAMKKYEGTYGLLKKTVVEKELSLLDWPQYYAKNTTFKNHLKALAETVRQQPTNTKALSILGYILATTGNQDQAKVIFERLIQRIPNDEFASFILQLLQK